MKRLSPVQKYVAYFGGVLVALLFPWLVLGVFLSVLPVPVILNSQYLSEDGHSFSTKEFKTNRKVVTILSDTGGQVESPVSKVEFVDRERRLFILQIAPNSKEAASLVWQTLSAARAMKRAKGIGATSSWSSPNSRGTHFADGDVFRGTAIGNLMIGMLAADSLKNKNMVALLQELGVAGMPSGTLARLSLFQYEHQAIIPVTFVLPYALLWVLGILLGGEWAARVEAQPGTSPVTVQELKRRFLEINDLDTPYQLKEIDDRTLDFEWRLTDRWKGFIGKGEETTVTTMRLRFREATREVTSFLTIRQVVRQKGAFYYSQSFSIVRMIPLFEYQSGRRTALSGKKGRLRVVSDQFTADISDLRHALTDLSTSSGWNWQPRLFRL